MTVVDAVGTTNHLSVPLVTAVSESLGLVLGGVHGLVVREGIPGGPSSVAEWP